MPLSPSPAEILARARADLRMGVPVVIADDEGIRLVAAVETLNAERLQVLKALGPVELAITAWRARTLKARVYHDDLARIAVPASTDVAWLAGLADPASDLSMPLKGPLTSLRDGPASIERFALALTKTARLLPAIVSVKADAATADSYGLTLVDARLPPPDSILEEVVSARVPLQVSEAGRLRVFRPDDGAEEHYAVEIGAPPRDRPVLARLHSACFTGDLLSSLKCDCGPQLKAALAQMGEAGAGVLLYLNQEGRGIGLANKMRAYSLQDQGFDTVEANHRLGFEDDERDFRIGADMLKRMGFRSVRLLTNNPAKVDMLRACGLDVVERVPLRAGQNPLNADYLATKAKKSGHIL
ncbi:MAG: GTP cyclohydrolase II [Pseudomonadota bacterium]